MEESLRSKFWRDVKFVFQYFKSKLDDAPPFILILIIALLFCLCVVAVIFAIGGIVSFCWNKAVTHMFAVPEISAIRGFILISAIGSLKFFSFYKFEESYNNKIEAYMKEGMEEHNSKVIAGVILIPAYIVDMFINGWFFQYSWNRIIPELFSVDLASISIWQAIAFSYLCSFLFGNSRGKGIISTLKDGKKKKDANEYIDAKNSEVDRTKTEETEAVNSEESESEPNETEVADAEQPDSDEAEPRNVE